MPVFSFILARERSGFLVARDDWILPLRTRRLADIGFWLIEICEITWAGCTLLCTSTMLLTRALVVWLSFYRYYYSVLLYPDEYSGYINFSSFT